MKNLKRLIIIITIFSIFLYSGCNRLSSDENSRYQSKQNLVETKPEKVGMSTERLTRIDKVIQQYVDNDWVPGAVAIVARHGKIVYHKSFGMRDVEAGDTLQKDDIFRMASMTKAIT
ncbi:MAG: beta-lactamase family protein, partial [Bacteroidales bacterium]|nr:beta-lactamase family protein [Bacteroidales bacterium]